MQHLDYLKYANFAMAALYALALLIVLVAVGLQIGLVVSNGADTSALIPLVIGGGAALFVVLALLVLFVVTGRMVGSGRGRILQTVLAVLNIGNCPGVFYAVYALWVCWLNDETKVAFEQA